MYTCISAVEHLRPLRGGVQAHLLKASDRNCYVTKFQTTPNTSELSPTKCRRHGWGWLSAYPCHR